ncbi:hypothetical protein JCM10450v2_000487 [Rhodotorula kratochvilovae]
MKATDPSAPAGRAVYAALGACILGVVLYCSFALPSYDNPLSTFDWTAWAERVKSGKADSSLHFQAASAPNDSLSSPSVQCGASPALLAEFGLHNLRLSQVHVGSGYRVQTALQKAARGEKLRVGLLGGSVSLGHGTDPVTKHRNKYGAVPYEEQYHQVIMRGLREAFPGVEHEFVLGAKAATDSSFFEWCWASLIGEDLDLVFVEMAVNDEYRNGMDSTENLLRSLLNLDSAPAVLFVDFFALQNGAAQKTILTGQDVQTSLASWYDVPQISARPVLLQAMIRDPELAQPLFLGDQRHGTAKVHRFLGSMVVGYLQEELCRMRRGGAVQGGNGGWPGTEGLGKVPRVKLNEGWDAQVAHPTKPPVCTVAGAGLEPVEESPDWRLFDWKYSKFYYETTVPDSGEIAFQADVREGAQGLLAVSYLRSRQYDLGRARCVAEGQEVTLDGYWGASTSLAQTTVVAKGLPPGPHVVRCRSLPPSKDHNGTAFRLMGVMTL